MKSTLLVVVLAAPMLSACISSGVRDQRIEPARTLSTQTGSHLSLEFPSGEVRVTRSSDLQLHASASFYCNSDSEACRSNAERARIVHDQRGEHSTIRFEPGAAYSTRHADLVFTVSVPPVTRLDVEMDAGSLQIDSPTGCLSASAGAGEITISAPANDVARVLLDANFGGTELSTPDGRVSEQRALLVGSELVWEAGSGACDLRAKLQAGGIDVTLRPNSE